MGTISSSVGLISGIDTQSVIDQLMAIEARPKNLVEEHVTELTSQKTAFLDVNARLLALKSSASSFLDSSVFGAYKATSSNTSVLTATASSQATAGNYTMTVERLVSTHQMISRGFTDSDTTTLGPGTITIESAAGLLTSTVPLSQLNGAQGVQRGIIRITDRSGASADIDLTRAVDLQDVIDAINNAGNINVSAAMTGDRLTLTDQTGSTASNLIVQSLGGKTTAEDLGIAGNSGGSDSLTGSQINYLSSRTALSSLNDGNGVRITSGAADLTIHDHAGNTFTVDLHGAGTLGDVIDAINDAASAAGSSVTAAIGSDGVSLSLTDSTAYSGNELSVDSSDAATDLGFIRADTDHDGLLEGDRLIAALGSKLLKNLNGGAGLTMDQAMGPSVLTPDTLLSDLFDGAGLTDDPANTDITIHARDQRFVSYIIELDGLTTVQDLIDAFDSATGGRVTLSIEGRALRATDHTGGSYNLAIEDRNFSQAMTELGLAVNAPVDTVLGNDTYPLPQPTSGFGPGSIRITTRDGQVNDISLTDARSVYDVIQAINDADIGVTASLNSAGNGLLLTDTTGGSGDLIIADVGSGTTATELGLAGTYSADTADSGDLDVQYVSTATRLDSLNNGRGVTAGQFTITDSTGASATIDLTQGNETTLADVIAEINSKPIGVTASINSTGDGLLLTDTAGGALPLTVAEAGSTTAADLGILGSDSDGDGVIDGSFETSITIDATDTLQDIIDAINAADAGVTASLINDGTASPYRINIVSDNSGLAGQFLFDDGGLGLDVQTLVEPSDAVVFFGSSDPTQAVLLTSSTNALTDTIQGVTIDLVGTSSDPVTLSITRDFDAIVSAVQTFVGRFNDLISRIDELDNYDSDTEQRGILLGDPTIAAIKRSLLSLISQQYDDVTGNYTYLSQVGLTLGDDAQLLFDESTLRAALATDPDAVSQLFSLETTSGTTDSQVTPGVTVPGSSPTITAQGFGSALKQLVESYTDSIDGRLTITTTGLDSQIQLANQRIAFLDTLLEARRQRLENQFTQMELALAQLQTQQSALANLQAIALQNYIS